MGGGLGGLYATLVYVGGCFGAIWGWIGGLLCCIVLTIATLVYAHSHLLQRCVNKGGTQGRGGHGGAECSGYTEGAPCAQGLRVHGAHGDQWWGREAQEGDGLSLLGVEPVAGPQIERSLQPRVRPRAAQVRLRQ